ncbi:MAG TPA: hypothetical protein DCF49_09490 [Lachnospiraceae bacterium]|nr:hypothetical protein [Lachnospiraceae bacterium]
MDIKGAYRQKEKWCGSRENGIYGQLFVPERADKGEKVPLVLFCHELYRTHESGIPYGRELAARGYAFYTFDCRGASTESRSPGSMLHMSVMTCARDLMEVYREVLTWPFTDPDRIILIGASQGAFSTAVAASQNPDLFAAVVLMYGAFVILDDVRDLYPDKESVPDPFDYRGWSMMGAVYLTDLWDYDLKCLGKYKGPVLVLHGDEDPLVDPSYSLRVAKIYQNAEFHMVRGGRHGFKKGAFVEAFQYICDFLTKNISFVDATL